MPTIKPQYAEAVVFFGDGNEANLVHVGKSEEQGYLVFYFIPTAKMRWKMNIQDSEFDPYDGWIKMKYKMDLCLQLDFDINFPSWLIMCNYHGDEDTPILRMHTELIRKNRILDRENANLRITLNKKRLEERKRILRPEERDLEVFDRMKRYKDASAPVTITAPQQEFGEE